jgi:two-component system, cell cycle response regulator DivK
VLVVEDNPIDLKLICALLQSSGCEAVPFSSSENVIATMLAQPPDILILDLNLGSTDGLDLARQIREVEQTRHVPLLAITAYPHRYPPPKVIEAGCDAWIVKPIDTRRLVGQLSLVRSTRPQSIRP